MSNNISYRDVQFTEYGPGIKIFVTTDRPCHLFCRYTTRQPWIHKKPSLRRGVQFAEDVRFCFTVYDDNEQEEPGDTLEHTFLKPAWGICQTRWNYFWGYVNDQVSPSTSPLFKYHHALGPYTLLFFEPWSALGPPPWNVFLFLERWSSYGLRLVFKEPWSEEAPPTHILVYTEPWTS